MYEQLRARVAKMSLQRAKHEGIEKDEALKDPNSKFFNDLQAYAMD